RSVCDPVTWHSLPARRPGAGARLGGFGSVGAASCQTALRFRLSTICKSPGNVTVGGMEKEIIRPAGGPSPGRASVGRLRRRPTIARPGETLLRRQGGARRPVPHVYGPIVAPGGQETTVRAERRAADPNLPPRQREDV